MRQRPVFEGTFCATHAVSTNSLPYMRRKNFSDLALLLSRSHHQFVPIDLVGVDPVDGGRVGEELEDERHILAEESEHALLANIPFLC